MSTTNPTYRRVDLSKLVIDTRYQRPLNEHRIGRMVDEWNPAQQGVLEVSKRSDGTHVVFDGQHRLAALRTMGRKTAPCLVHDGLDAQGEAALFVRLQRDRKAITPVDRFRAQLFSGDPDAQALSAAMTEAGYRIGFGEYDVKAVASVERLARRHGLDVVSRTFEVIRDAWFRDPGSLDGAIIGGVGEVLADYSDRWEERHTNRLRNQAPIDIKRRARGKAPLSGGGGAYLAVAAEIRKAAGITGRPRKPVAEASTLALVS